MKKILLILTLTFSFFAIPLKKVSANNIEIVGPDTIYKQASSIVLMSDILDMYSSESGTVNLVSDDYTGYGDVPGIYEFKLQVGSKIVTKNIEVKNLINDKILAVSKTANEYAIHVNKNFQLTNAEIPKILERIGVFTLISSDQVLKLSDTYSENYNSPGVYVFEFRVVNASGNSANYYTKVIVQADNKISMDGIPIDMGNGDSGSIWMIAIGVIVLLGLGVYVFGGKKK